MFKRLIASLVCFTFLLSNLQLSYAQDFSINQLPVPGTMVGESVPFAPLALKGLIVNPMKPLEFQFIVDTGRGPQDTSSVKDQADQLVKYFLAGLTIPEGDLWVNLSPYEKNRMVPEALGQTDLGRDLLAQDYILKQLTASLIYPEKDLGKEFWSRVYAKAQQQLGTTNIPINTFNKVWILPNEAQVFENGNAAYVTKSTLKVMLDEDYLAKQKHSVRQRSSIPTQIVRAIILPEIEKEVNTGKNFAPLRQIYQALILAKWYKETIQNGLLDTVYTNKNKVAGVNLNDPSVKEKIYERYLKAYKKGAFNYIKDDPAPDGQVVPRKYFSGGISRLEPAHVNVDGAMSAVKYFGSLLALTISLTAQVQTATSTRISEVELQSLLSKVQDDDWFKSDFDALRAQQTVDAIAALAQYGDEKAVEPITQKILEEYSYDQILPERTDRIEHLSDALVKIGPSAIPGMMKVLNDFISNDGKWRGRTIGDEYSVYPNPFLESLSKIIVKIGQPALPELLKVLKYNHWKIQGFAALTLNKLGWEPQTIQEKVEFYLQLEKIHEHEVLMGTFPMLLDRRPDEDPFDTIIAVAFDTVDKLGHLAIPELAKELNELVIRGRKDPGNAYVSFVSDDEERVYRILERIGGEQAIETVRRELGKMSSVSEETRAKEVLKEMGASWWQRQSDSDRQRVRTSSEILGIGLGLGGLYLAWKKIRGDFAMATAQAQNKQQAPDAAMIDQLQRPLNLTMSPAAVEVNEAMQEFKSHAMFTAGMTPSEVQINAAMAGEILKWASENPLTASLAAGSSLGTFSRIHKNLAFLPMSGFLISILIIGASFPVPIYPILLYPDEDAFIHFWEVPLFLGGSMFLTGGFNRREDKEHKKDAAMFSVAKARIAYWQMTGNIEEIAKMLDYREDNIRRVAMEALDVMARDPETQFRIGVAAFKAEHLRDGGGTSESTILWGIKMLGKTGMKKAIGEVEQQLNNTITIRQASRRELDILATDTESKYQVARNVIDSNNQVDNLTWAIQNLQSLPQTPRIKKTVVDGNIRALHSTVWRDAAKELGVLGDNRAIEPLLGMFGYTGDDLSAVEEALAKLGASDQIVDGYIRSLSQPAIEIEIRSAKRLGDLGDRRAVEPLLGFLKEEDDSLRSFAEEALTKLGASKDQLVKAYISALTNNGDVRSNAIKKLGDLGGNLAVESLIGMLNDRDSKVRLSIAQALSKSGDISFLLGILKDTDRNVSFSSAQDLFEIGNRSREVLLRLDVRKKLEARQPAGAQPLINFENEAYQYALEGYDFKVIFEPGEDHWEEETETPQEGWTYANSGAQKLVVDKNEVLHIERGDKLDRAMLQTSLQYSKNDKVSLAKNGGIDFNQIKVNRTGETVNVQFDPAQLNALEQEGFEGFTPVITGMTRISSPFPLLGINHVKQELLARL